MYKLNLDGGTEKQLLAAVFEKCISAEPSALRTLIALAASGELSEETFCEKLALTQKEITAALDCFVDAEILARRGKTYTFCRQSAPSQSPAERTPAKMPAQVPVEQVPVLSASEAAVRLSEAPELRFLTESLQESFGRLLTQNEISHLISICDYTGLSADIMLMIIEYAALSGKSTLAYIKKVALDWAAREITTHAGADEQIKQLLARNNAAPVVKRAFSILDRELVSKEKDFALKWVTEYGYSEEILTAAHQICVMNTGKVNFSYIDKVLTNWHNDGVVTLADTEKKRTSASQKNVPAAGTDEFRTFAARKRKL